MVRVRLLSDVHTELAPYSPSAVEADLGAGVRVLGATLWTDFALFGVSSVFASSETARAGLNDYRRIRTSPRFCKLRPIDTQREHRESVAWLRARLAETTDGPTIVVTHHAPSLRSIPPHFATDPLTPAYASHLDELVESSGAALWLHGHTHHASDYRIGDTRVVCNPRGYADDLVPGFGPQLLLEV